MATDWSEEAKARRSASAKKAAETRKANREKNWGLKPIKAYSYYQNSRVARWALASVSVIAMSAFSRKVRDRTFLARQVAEEKTAEMQYVYRRISQHSVKILNK